VGRFNGIASKIQLVFNVAVCVLHHCDLGLNDNPFSQLILYDNIISVGVAVSVNGIN
jgi:hypothetical protein